MSGRVDGMTSCRRPKAIVFSGHPQISMEIPAGYSTHLLGIARGLEQLDFDVELIVAGGGRGKEASPAPSSSWRRVARSWVPRILWNGLRDARQLVADRHGAALLGESTCPPTFLYERASFGHVAGQRRARSLGIPHVLEVNAPLSERTDFRGRSILDRVIESRTLQVMQRADLVVFVTEALAERYSTLLNGQLPPFLVRGNAIDPADFELAHRPVQLAQPWLAGVGSGPIVGFLGSLMFWTGLEDAFTAVVELRKEWPALCLVIIGDGEHRGALEAEVAARGLGSFVHILGSVSRPEALAIVRHFDVAIMPRSNDYRSPIKLFEYAASGVPIVAPDERPVRQLLRHGREALLVGPRAEDLTSAIATLLRDSVLSEELAHNARSLVVENFTWRAAAADVTRSLGLDGPSRA